MTIDKTPPNARGIELSVLGGMMIDNEAVTEAMNIITEDEANHIKELLIRKNRYGATGTVYFRWQPEWTRFEILDY